MLKPGRRYLFVPHDYRVPPVPGEVLGFLGFVPDAPLPDPRLSKMGDDDGNFFEIRRKSFGSHP